MTDTLFGIPRCVCGHHRDAHHTTPTGRSTWCSCWDPDRCDCMNYEPQPDEKDITDGETTAPHR